MITLKQLQYKAWSSSVIQKKIAYPYKCSQCLVDEWLTYTSLGEHHHYCCVLLSSPSVYLSGLSSLHYSSSPLPPPYHEDSAIFNMLTGNMSTPNATELIQYFVCVHSSFGPIHVLAFSYCHACWDFRQCPQRGRNTFQRLLAGAQSHTLFCRRTSRLSLFLCSTQNTMSENRHCGEKHVCQIFGALPRNFVDANIKRKKKKLWRELGIWRCSH